GGEESANLRGFRGDHVFRRGSIVRACGQGWAKRNDHSVRCARRSPAARSTEALFPSRSRGRRAVDTLFKIRYLRECTHATPLIGVASIHREGPGVAQREIDEFDRLEATHPHGVSAAQIVDFFAPRGVKLAQATFRKYVQLGLLPRSRRVGEKGKHRGSRGLYPASAARRIRLIKSLMDEGMTLEEIRGSFVFFRGQLDGVERSLEEPAWPASPAAKAGRPEQPEAPGPAEPRQRARTMSRKEMARQFRQQMAAGGLDPDLQALAAELEATRPKVRADCAVGPRPCP